MTLFFNKGEISILSAREDKIRCSECGHRLASWGSHPYHEDNDSLHGKFVGEHVPYCGWCLMYGKSQWGHDNADEILYVGSYVKRSAETNLGKNTHIPELDVRHRLNWQDSERYIMGILFTSRTLGLSFRRMGIIHQRLHDFYEESDGRQADGDSEAQRDVPETSGGSEG